MYRGILFLSSSSNYWGILNNNTCRVSPLSYTSLTTRCDAHTLKDNKKRELEPEGPNASTATQLEYKSLDKQLKYPNP